MGMRDVLLRPGLTGRLLKRSIDNLRYQYQYQVTITEAAQTTTPKFTFGAGAPAAEVDWGDSTRSTVTSGVELSHAYAAPGVYTVTLHMPQQEQYLTQVDIGGDRVTGDLWSKNIGRFAALQRLYGYNNTGLSGGFTLSDLPAGMTYLLLSSTQSTITGALADLPAGMTYLYLQNTSSAVTGGASPVAARGIREVRIDNTGLNQTQVDDVIARIYADRALFTSAAPILNIGGTNAAPSGVYQDATPPTTGKEMIYKLVNDPDGEGFKKWTIIYTA